jgi:hypothetical protein
LPPWAKLSTVSIFLPAAALTGKAQERTAAPSNSTVQEPQAAIPQPYFVPVNPICSRITHNNGVLGSTSTDLALPFTVSFTMQVSLHFI